MRKAIIKFLLLIVAVAAFSGFIFSCEDPVEELRMDGCAPNMPGWPECIKDSDQPSISKR
jgi:hypothetical protein